MAHINAVTPAQLCHLMDLFEDEVARIGNLDVSTAPMNQQITDILMRNDELVRHIAAIGRNVPVEQLKPGAFGNFIAALATIVVTSASPSIGDLVQIFAIKSGMALPPMTPPLPDAPHLRVVGGTEA